jgi:hypothetical protein
VYLIGSQVNISKTLEKSPKTIEFHLKKLLEFDIIEPAEVKKGIIDAGYKIRVEIEENPKGREIFYRLKNPYKVYDLLLNYKEGLVNDDTLINVLDVYESFFTDGEKRVKSEKDTIDRIFDSLWDIFPPPYR